MSELLGRTKSETPIARFPVNGAALRARLMAASHRLALSRDATALCALGVLNAMLMTLTWGAWGDLGADTGYDSLAADWSPGVSFRTSTSSTTTGRSHRRSGDSRPGSAATDLAPRSRLGSYSRGVSSSACTRWRARRFHPWVRFWPRPLTAPVAFAPNNLSFVLAHSASAPLAILVTLGFLLALYRYSVTEDRAGWPRRECAWGWSR